MRAGRRRIVMLNKASSGIQGFDEITGGGFPAGRPTLLCGGPGSGKTLLAVQFLAHGAMLAGEPGLLVSFDERAADIETNNISLGLDLADLGRRNLLAIDYVHLDRTAIVETGEFDLEGLFIRMGVAIDRIGARRVVLDSIDTLFAGIPNEAILRSELRRLFDWLKARELTTIVTAERGETGLTRHGLEEYVSDCVIVLDNRVHNQLATRRLRIVKYRGSAHGADEYPFLIEKTGFTLLPVTSLGLGYAVSSRRLTTGIAGLDAMLEGGGFYEGSSILVSGGPGTGKTSIGAQFAAATSAAGRTCLYFAFEESEPQIARNMRSIGIDLAPLVAAGTLSIRPVRPTLYGLEMHLSLMLQAIRSAKPDVVVIDPLSALEVIGTTVQSSMMVLRLIDYLKSLGITAVYLSVQDGEMDSQLNISSMMDTWIRIRNSRRDDGFERQIFVVKSRGMAHSAEVRRMTLGAGGVEIGPRSVSG